ncbi:urea amidolyase family protein [Pseudofrankia asymbiotica]|uniref:Allophanate hydrolase n=1 Tax=Pseudofrankia asymbiotica TaxID=1834516 RepID=A0A1V2IE21_9ACTN|nr:urea amidolyase family protein [Pseudofrankia asymbiotica]ONH31442.1 hypothetical protein BL253_09385 [Pseudofrankia asymbiotica]
MRTLRCGAEGVLVELDDLDAAQASYDALRQAPPAGVVDLVPAARTVLVTFAADRTDATSVTTAIRAVLATALPATTHPNPVRERAPAGGLDGVRVVEIPVRYDGPDLADVARLTGLTEAEVVRRHTAAEHRVAFCGFAPGFAYITGLDRALRLARRPVPRARVPAGSVAIADEFSGVYPTASPGGWHLLGTTALRPFDLDRDPPFALPPGTRVRFVDLDARPGPETQPDLRTRPALETRPDAETPRAGFRRAAGLRADHGAAATGAATMIEVLATGPLATVQDEGRPGLAHLGVPRSGAADRGSHRLANRLVGNRAGAATVEATFGGLAVRFERAALVALTGARCEPRLDGRDVGMYAPLDVPAGARLDLGSPVGGLRTYLAVRGGVEVAAVLGSRSTDLLSGLGPAALRAGQLLTIGNEIERHPGVDLAPQPRPPLVPELRVIPGPRVDWFDPSALAALTGAAFEVSQDSNRVGIRLLGPTLRRGRGDELPSEGVVRGAVQVPHSGEPVVFLADHPVTGGYPVLAVVLPDDVDLAAQCRPGQRLRFRLAVRGRDLSD